MINLIVSLIFVLLSFSLSWGGGITFGGGDTLVGGGSPVSSSYLINQTFEGTGYDNSESWTETGTGTIDEDYTTEVLDGTQSLYISGADYNSPTTTSPSWTAVSPTYLFFMFQLNSGNLVNADFFEILNGTTLIARLMAGDFSGADFRIYPYHGDTIGSAFDAVVGTTYYIWVEYEKGTGANGHLHIRISTTSTKPGSYTMAITTGTSTLDADNIKFRLTYANPATGIFDRLRVNATALGDNGD